MSDKTQRYKNRLGYVDDSQLIDDCRVKIAASLFACVADLTTFKYEQVVWVIDVLNDFFRVANVHLYFLCEAKQCSFHKVLEKW